MLKANNKNKPLYITLNITKKYRLHKVLYCNNSPEPAKKVIENNLRKLSISYFLVMISEEIVRLSPLTKGYSKRFTSAI